MNRTIFKQLDSKWSGLAYPTKASSFGGNGCGCCACTHIAIEQESKKDWTPKKLRKWMVSKGYAISGQGTTWNGITETLKYIGHNKVVRIWDDPMSEAWKELNKGDRIGIILFNSNVAPNGTRWTSGGHYVAFTNYRIKNKKHQFYCKDSGGRDHDGWYTYETSMKGCVAKIWIVKRIYTTQEKMCNWAKKTADSKKYKYKYFSSKYGSECAVCYPHDGKNKGWNCIGFAFATWRHGGKLKCKCNCEVINNATWETLRKLASKDGTKIVQQKTGLDDVKVIRTKGGKKIPLSKLKKGDIIAYFNGNKYVHTALYIGNGKIADCTSGRTPNIKYGAKSYTSMTIKAAIRYTGK